MLRQYNSMLPDGYYNWTEWWQEKSGLSTGVLSDCIDTFLTSEGYTGTITDKMIQFFGGDSWENQQAYFADTTLADLKAVGGLTFFKDFSTEALDADYSVGSPTATFTSARDATHPATYVDSAGLIQTTTTADVGRFDYGYYDATGYHAFDAPKLHIEGASTNLITHSNDIENAWWTDITMTSDNADAGSSSPDGTATAPSITATDADSYLISDTVTAQTYSVWLKRKTGTGVIKITADSDVNSVEITVTSEWRRFSVTAASAAQQAAIEIETSGDAVYVWGNQFENLGYATSYIPTTVAALTRNLEVLKYPVASNRTVATEGYVVSFIPEYASTSGTFNYLSDTETKRRFVLFNTTNDILVRVNTNDSVGSEVADLINDTWTAHTPMTIGYSVQHSSPYIACFYQGVPNGTNETADDFIDNAWGTDFYVGVDSTSANQLNGWVDKVVFYNKALSTAEQATIAGLI